MDFDEDPDYLDLDDILAHSQRVQCKFLLDIPGLEFLSPMLEEGTQGQLVLLPFWMARTLYTYSMIDIDIPEPYSRLKREQLEIESHLGDLHKDGPYFYHFGRLLLNLRREKGNNLAAFTEEGQRNKYRREEGETLGERREIATHLINTFHHRRKLILDHSLNKSMEASGSVVQFEKRLDNMEHNLFQLGRQIISDLKKWDSGNNDRVSSSQIAARLSKKRRIETIQDSQEQNKNLNK